ncbi:Uncharacterised protein [Acinetobacter baumannii]|nr:Uncharacterised protein [Acinetobacter baumannii]
MRGFSPLPNIAAAIDYYWHTKTLFRLVNPKNHTQRSVRRR